ncbi:MAG TPA: PEGA domain-containing protein, partial [Polyangia bacterium]
EEDAGDIHDDPTAAARESDNRIIAAWPSLFDRSASSPAPVAPAMLTPPLGSLGGSPPVLPYTPPGGNPRGTPAGGVQAPAPTNPPFPPAPSAPLSPSVLPPAVALPDLPEAAPSPVGTMTLPYSAPRERINTPPLSALVGEAKGPSKFPHTLTGGTLAPPELRPPSPPLGAPMLGVPTPPMPAPGAPTMGAPTPVAPSFFAPPPPAQSISPLSSLAPRAIEPTLPPSPHNQRGLGARFMRALLVFGFGLGAIAAVVHFTLVPLPVLAVWRSPARLSVRSEPSGASVAIDGRQLTARTPTYVEVTRDRSAHEVTVTLAGYEPVTQLLRFDRAVVLEASFVLERGAGAVVADAGAPDAGENAQDGAASASGEKPADAAGPPPATPPGLPARPGAPPGPPTAAAGAVSTKATVRRPSRRKTRMKGKAARQRRTQRSAASAPGR